MFVSVKLLQLCLLAATALASPAPFPATDAFAEALSKRQSTGSNPLAVDLGYTVYQGANNSTLGINSWKGIRYAQAPVGKLRWQAPLPPLTNRSATIQATSLPTRCPQAPAARPVTTPYNFTAQAQGNEDCLFLSVYAPQNATKLPVLVWIHGGGYGGGAGTQDLSAIIQANNHGFVGVAIQYRLGAFGFMSSDEINTYGVVNAGLLDQNFALQWVQSYISQFGGDPRKVTIAGESAGGGSVMLQAMAYGGFQGTSLYNNIAAASPYLPQQFGYADFVPTQSYYAFAALVGCFPGIDPQGSASGSIFQCLQGVDTMTLQNASYWVSFSGRYGTWGFLPVTDGTFVQQLPTQQLLKKQVNGVNMLIGNNANEGFSFTPQNIETEDDFVSFVRRSFPKFSESDVSKVLMYYPSTNDSVDNSDPRFATLGNSGPTALNQSSLGTGQQQRANNLYAETTFVCPAYWMAEAFSDKGRNSFKYQYSIPPATHGADVSGYFGPAAVTQSPEFEQAFMSIWGNFVMSNNPSIPNVVANGNATNNTANPTSNWPPFTIASPMQINLNITGGVLLSAAANATLNITEYIEPGIKNDFSLVNAYTWEGGRGQRCDFWRSLAAIVPE